MIEINFRISEIPNFELITSNAFKTILYHKIYFYCREIRSGDTIESVINILPLQLGKLVLDGFYLEENEDGRERDYTGTGVHSGARKKCVR